MLTLSLWLAGCATTSKTNITFYSDEYWQVITDLTYEAQTVQSIGSMIDTALEQRVNELKAQGMSASFSGTKTDGGGMKYRLTLSGQGFALLNSAVFSSKAQIQLDKTTNPQQITFSYAPPTGFGSSLALFNTYSLSGSKIVSSNGSISGGTVTWINPTVTMQATLTPAARLDWLPLLLIVGGVGVLGIVIFFVIDRVRGSKCPDCGAKIPRGAEYCPECGVPT